MRFLVPFAVREPNTRLASLFEADERREFATVLLEDVLDAIRASGGSPEILATAPLDRDCPVHVDDRSLSTALNAILQDATEPVAIVMADLGLATPASFEALLEPDADIVLAPGLGGGTNAMVVRDTSFRVDYHGGSYQKHREAATECGASVETVDSFRLAVDIDEQADLAELLLHGTGAGPAWLRDAGVILDRTGGRCTVRRAQSGD